MITVICGRSGGHSHGGTCSPGTAELPFLYNHASLRLHLGLLQAAPCGCKLHSLAGFEGSAAMVQLDIKPVGNNRLVA
jgi:hypothetical protein